MNEPPGARARVAQTGLTICEYFRDVWARTCFCLSTTFSDSHRLTPRCLPFWAVSHPLSVTSQPCPPILVASRSASPPPPRVPSPLSRLFTCQLTILRILPLQPPSLTWMPPLCYRDRFLSWASTLVSTLSTPPLPC